MLTENKHNTPTPHPLWLASTTMIPLFNKYKPQMELNQSVHDWQEYERMVTIKS